MHMQLPLHLSGCLEVVYGHPGLQEQLSLLFCFLAVCQSAYCWVCGVHYSQCGMNETELQPTGLRKAGGLLLPMAPCLLLSLLLSHRWLNLLLYVHHL